MCTSRGKCHHSYGIRQPEQRMHERLTVNTASTCETQALLVLQWAQTSRTQVNKSSTIPRSPRWRRYCSDKLLPERRLTASGINYLGAVSKQKTCHPGLWTECRRRWYLYTFFSLLVRRLCRSCSVNPQGPPIFMSVNTPRIY